MMTDHTKDQLGKHRAGVISEMMPEFIKIAEEEIVSEDLTKLADGCFAYSDGINRYFPIHTPEHTWLSHAYFEKFAHTIEQPLADTIRRRIKDAYAAFELPEESVVKIASQEDEVDVLHTLSVELNKFLQNYKNLHPHERRERAKQLTQYAKGLNRESAVTDPIRRYSGDYLRGDFMNSFMDRMRYFMANAPERQMLLRMQSEAPRCVPERVAKALLAFDRNAGIAKHYDIDLDDPYVSVLTDDPHKAYRGHEDDLINIDGHKISLDKLKNFNWDSLSDTLESDILGDIKHDPIMGIQSAPRHIRVVIIRRLGHDR